MALNALAPLQAAGPPVRLWQRLSVLLAPALRFLAMAASAVVAVTATAAGTGAVPHGSRSTQLPDVEARFAI